MRIHRVLAGVVTAMLPCFAPAQQDTLKEIERYRQPLHEGNPAELYEAPGEDLWKTTRGPENAPPMSHPKERLAYQAGERLFYYRAGPYDFGCVTCHGDEGKRIRLQSLPKMDNAKDAQRAFGTWPGYRVSEGELRSMQWRMWECIRQMRFPELEFASDASIALITYLAQKAEGGTFIAPAIKR